MKLRICFTLRIQLGVEKGMTRTIEAIFEDGVLKPLGPLKLKEHGKVRITLEEGESVARATSGMLSGLDDSIIEEIALSPEFLVEEA
jgi:predicted DNA-binding antitoxin AbrB/MazE fold protein